jgi:DNA-binding transcriptional LysR family regulator
MDNLGWLHAFVHAAETRSFTQAGRQLGVSSSAIGKSIGRLEQRLGVRLFHRSTRTITLTQEGGSFLERCRRILGEIEAAEEEIARTQGQPRGRLRVSLPLLGVVMMPAINCFIRAYPDIQLDLEFTDRLVDVIDEGFDAVIRAGEVTDSRLMNRMLGEFRLKLVASSDYLKRRGVPQVPEDLGHHACLHHRYTTSGTFERWPLRRDGREIEIMPASAVIVNTIEPLISMTEQGLGIACLPDLALRRQFAEGTLQTVLDDYVEHAGPMRLLWPSSRHLAPKLRAFVDFMGEQLFPAQVLSPQPAWSRELPGLPARQAASMIGGRPS